MLQSQQCATSLSTLSLQCSLGSVNSLRFALSHPLIEADEGMRAPSRHLELTTAAKMKRRERKLAPLTGAISAPLPVTEKATRILTMEGMLEVGASD